MLTNQKLISEKYIADTLKKEEQAARREKSREEMKKVTTYLVAMGIMMATVVLFLTSETWMPMLKERFAEWGLNRFSFLPW
ncbi:MAG: hypothetical protein R3C03_20515 [Pirellulaceae bacterium]